MNEIYDNPMLSVEKVTTMLKELPQVELELRLCVILNGWRIFPFNERDCHQNVVLKRLLYDHCFDHCFDVRDRLRAET